ncbi:retrotransposon protein, putative, ty1-copia subclass [Tanacetum coccineum]|uniref:Retrotransposon protein, putative, ty1-copia subclass n=1 Tax=Tanacetum coccineum TaxID=301880 RepID=A0ABQ5EXF9_9ASTR
MGYAPVQAPPFAPKPKNPPTPKKDNPVKDAICHQCGKVGHWRRNCPVYLAKLMKKKKLSQGASTLGIFTIELYYFPCTSWVYDTSCGTHICITTQGLRGSRKLKPGALSLYVGDGHRATIEAIGEYHLCLPKVENHRKGPLWSLRSDRGGEYMSQEFLDHLKEHRIITHRTPPYTPQHNGVSERRNRTLLDIVRSIMSQTTLPKSFWDYALETAARILNMVPTKKVDKTPYEVWHGQSPKLSYLKVWGCKALVKRDTLTKPDKLEPRSIKCIFVGYPKETMGYSFYYPPENKVFFAQNAEFFKNSLITQEASGSLEDLEIIQEEDTHPSIDTSLHHDEDDQEIDEPQSDSNPIRKSTKTRRAPNRMCLHIDAEEHELGDLGEPANYKSALLDPEFKKWLDAMNVEMQSMKDNDIWDLVDLPPNGKTIGRKWLFKKKIDMDDIRAIRILIAIAAFYDYEIWQMDIKTAFLNGHLSEEIYMVQPEGFVNPKYPNRYIAAYDASKEAVWVRKFISRLGIVPTIEEPISMYCDNIGAITIANESGITKGDRYFHAKVHYLCEVIEFGDVKLEKVYTDDNLADPLL